MEYNVRVAEVLRSLSRAADVAAAKPLGFSQRVARAALALAEEANVAAEQRGSLMLAGLLHGVGLAAVAPHLANLMGSDERPTLARFPGDVLLTVLEQGAADDEGHATNVFMRHLLALGHAPEITHAWLEQVGLGDAGLLALSIQERYDGSGAPRGVKGRQVSREAWLLAAAWLLTSLRHLAEQAPGGDERAQRAAELLGDVSWIEAQSGRVFDPSLSDAIAALWANDVFWSETAVRARAEAPEGGDEVVTTEARASAPATAPITAEAEAPQTQERFAQPAKAPVGDYVRGRYDVDEDVPDTDRHIDDLLYPRFGAFLEPTSPQLQAWLGLLSQMADAKDGFPEGHSVTVAQLCRELGLVLGLEDAALLRLVLAARVYRCGRLCLSSALLAEETRLSDAQRRQLKVASHVTRSILSPLAPLGDVVQIAALHTERFDGSGHPERLEGAAIPLGARVLAVADTYVALISPRPYRPAYSRSRALAIIQAQSGSLFDGLVTDSLEAVARGQI